MMANDTAINPLGYFQSVTDKIGKHIRLVNTKITQNKTRKRNETPRFQAVKNIPGKTPQVARSQQWFSRNFSVTLCRVIDNLYNRLPTKL